jgi:hypothetical protein
MTTTQDLKFTLSREGIYLVQLRDEAGTSLGEVLRDGAGWTARLLDGSYQRGTAFPTRQRAAERLIREYELATGLRDDQDRHVAQEPDTNLWFVADHSGRRISSRWTDKADAIAKLASLQPLNFEAVGRQAALNDESAAPVSNADVRYALAGHQVGDPENIRIMEAFQKGYQAVRDEQAAEVLAPAHTITDRDIRERVVEPMLTDFDGDYDVDAIMADLFARWPLSEWTYADLAYNHADFDSDVFVEILQRHDLTADTLGTPVHVDLDDLSEALAAVDLERSRLSYQEQAVFVLEWLFKRDPSYSIQLHTDGQLYWITEQEHADGFQPDVERRVL